MSVSWRGLIGALVAATIVTSGWLLLVLGDVSLEVESWEAADRLGERSCGPDRPGRLLSVEVGNLQEEAVDTSVGHWEARAGDYEDFVIPDVAEGPELVETFDEETVRVLFCDEEWNATDAAWWVVLYPVPKWGGGSLEGQSFTDLAQARLPE